VLTCVDDGEQNDHLLATIEHLTYASPQAVAFDLIVFHPFAVKHRQWRPFLTFEQVVERIRLWAHSKCPALAPSSMRMGAIFRSIAQRLRSDLRSTVTSTHL
jgi:hypothetical protein